MYVQFGVMLSLLHYWCDSMRLLCVVWSVGKCSACFVMSKRENFQLFGRSYRCGGWGVVTGGVSALSRGAGVSYCLEGWRTWRGLG